MSLPEEQTPLIFSNRENSSNHHPRRNRDSFYSTQRRDDPPSATSTFYGVVNGSPLDRHDHIPQPQRQRQPQPQPQLLHQSLDRAHRQEQAHTITTRHWIVLLLACLLLFGNYYCYDIPAALNIQLRDWLETDYATHQYHLNLLYSVYSLPNIILPLFGGVLIDRLSASRMLILFSICICAGQWAFALGVSLKSIWIMVLGRFVFGIGGECLEVAQAKITTDWFKSRWLGFALGLNLSSARIATAMNDNVSPLIEGRGGGVIGASWAGFGVCVMSLLCGWGLAYLDSGESRKQAGVRLDARDRRKDLMVQSRTENIVGRQAINVSSDSTMTMSSEALEEEDEIEKENEMAEDDQMRFSEILTLQPNFWILSLCCISLYGAVVPFNHISSDFLQKKWHISPTKAGTIMSIPDIVSSIGSPVCGYLVDRFGNRARYIPLSAVFIICAHTLFGFTAISPVVAMVILGLAYSLFASVLWPCIPFLVEDHQLGTAYGLVTIALNISLTFFPMVVASILHGTGGSFIHVLGLFIALGIIGLFLSGIFNVLDYRQGGYIQLIEQGPSTEAQYQEDDYYGHRPRQDLSQQQRVQRQDRYNPREPGFEYRRHRRFSEDLLQEEDPDIEDVQDMVTTRAVGEGIITIIPHRRRHSMAGFAGHMERTRLGTYAHHARVAPELNGIPGSVPHEPSPYLASRPRFAGRQ